MTVLLVGDKPSTKNENPNVPFVGTRSHETLKEWMKQLGVKDYIAINQIDFNTDELRDLYAVGSDLKIIALGNNADKALRDVPHFKLPHPSGKNRLLNDRKYVDFKLDQCKEWLRSR